MGPGCLAVNPHKGSASEYLAQYAFAMLGYSVSVPHQEDAGIDLFCGLTKTAGQRAWVRDVFTVQVKSNAKVWLFNGDKSVRWFIRHPLPLFLCVVEKKKARLHVYHTLPRFHLWAMRKLPSSLSLKPSAGSEGFAVSAPAQDDHPYVLGAPIVSFPIQDLLAKGHLDNVKRVLAFWVGVDRKNIFSVQMGLRQFYQPERWTTNEIPGPRRVWAELADSDKHARNEFVGNLRTYLLFLRDQLSSSGDSAGALRANLLIRHLYPGDDGAFVSSRMDIAECLGVPFDKTPLAPGTMRYVPFASEPMDVLDSLSAALDQMVAVRKRG